MADDPKTWGARILALARQDAGIEPRPAMPSVTRAIANFAQAALAHTVAGRPCASDEATAWRIAICESCPNFTESRACRLCGCNMDVKVRWADMACPIGLWAAVPGA